MNSKLLSGGHNRILALLVGVAILLSIVAVGLSTTLAAKSDITAEFTDPHTNYRHVEVGQTTDRTIASANGWQNSDSSIISLSAVTGKSVATLTGVKAGTAVISVGTKTGVAMALPYQVTDSNNITKYILANGGEGVIDKTDGSGTLTIPIRTFTSPEGATAPQENTAAKNSITWSTFRENDPVASVDANGVVTGLSKGVTIIVGTFSDKWGQRQDLHFLVGVGVKLDYGDAGNGGDDGNGNGGGNGGDDGNGNTTPSAKPELAPGRILTAAQAGDSSDWVEIARQGDYSLIIRRKALAIDFEGQGPEYGFRFYAHKHPPLVDNNYDGSDIRKILNEWYSRPEGVTGGTISLGASLRTAAVKNTAMENLGELYSLTDGFSNPTGERATIYNSDTVFPLSFAEAAEFCSIFYRESATAAENSRFSSEGAQENAKLLYEFTDEYNRDYNDNWLRSPGSSRDYGTILGAGHLEVKDIHLSLKASLRPAMWVDSEIFGR
jgi:hypothetical protein